MLSRPKQAALGVLTGSVVSRFEMTRSGARKLSPSTIQEIIPRKRSDAFMRNNLNPSHQTILPTVLVYGLSHNY